MKFQVLVRLVFCTRKLPSANWEGKVLVIQNCHAHFFLSGRDDSC